MPPHIAPTQLACQHSWRVESGDLQAAEHGVSRRMAPCFFRLTMLTYYGTGMKIASKNSKKYGFFLTFLIYCIWIKGIKCDETYEEQNPP
jgi:hypothetical protein